MILAGLLSWALASDLDRERAEAALDSEAWARARTAALAAIEDDPLDLLAHLAYLDACKGAGSLRVALPAYLSGGTPLHEAVVALHDTSRGDGETAVLENLSPQLGEDLAVLIQAMGRLEASDADAALDLLGDRTDPEALELRLWGLRDGGRLRELHAWAREAAERYPDRPDLLVPIGVVEDRKLETLRKRTLRSIDARLASAEPLYLYRARRFAMEVRAFELSREIVERLKELGEVQPLHRPPRASGTRRATAVILARRGRAQILPGPPSEMRHFVTYLSEIFLEEGNDALAIELWSRFRGVEDTAENALQHGRLVLPRDGEEAYRAALAAALLAARGTRADPGRLDFDLQRGLLAEAWALRADAEVATGREEGATWSTEVARVLGTPGEPAEKVAAQLDALVGKDTEDRLVNTTTAALLAPDQQRFASRAALLEEVGDVDAAFVAHALAGSPSEALDRTWRGIGPSAPAARAAVASWKTLGGGAEEVELVSAGTARGDRPRLGEPMPSWQVTTPDGPLDGGTLAGQVVLLSFWASWCQPCLVELPALDALAARLSEEGSPVSIVAISVDAQQGAYRKALARMRLRDLTSGWNPGLKERFRLRSLPQSFLVDPEGVVVHTTSGFSPGDEVAIEDEIRGLLR